MRVPAAALVLVAALAGVARADDDLAEARRLEAGLEYERALAMVDRLLARGEADPAQLAELHLLAGKLAAGLDRQTIAEDHFARLLALRPDATLPDGTSPKLIAPFEAARARAVPLRVTVLREGDVLALATSGDPLGLVAGIGVRVVDATGQPSFLREPARVRILVPPDARPVEVDALDASGNRVWIGPPPAGAASQVPAHAVPARPPAPSRSALPLYARWTTWAAVGGVALVVGGISAWQFQVSQNDWDRLRADAMPHDYSELRGIEDRGNRWAIAADASFGVAAAAGLAAIIAFAARTDEPPPVSVTAGAGTVGLAGHF